MVAHSRDARHSRSARRLNEPRPVRVAVRDDGIPEAVNGVAVTDLREEWRVSDRWWTEEPVRRRYFDVVVATGENIVVFEDEAGGAWYRQHA